MTGRTCPVHGEYSESGVCRWCEPLPAPDAVELPGMAGLWRPPDRVERKDGVPSYFWDLGTVALPKPVSFFDVALSGQKVRPVIEPTPWIRSLGPALHVERTESYIDAETHAAEESRLHAQHAALRWDRVARRWGSKHPTMLDLAKGWGLFVVEAMREHVEKLARTNPLLQDKPREPKP